MANSENQSLTPFATPVSVMVPGVLPVSMCAESALVAFTIVGQGHMEKVAWSLTRKTAAAQSHSSRDVIRGTGISDFRVVL